VTQPLRAPSRLPLSSGSSRPAVRPPPAGKSPAKPPAARPPQKPARRSPGGRSGAGRLLWRGLALLTIWGATAGLILLVWVGHDLPDVTQAVQFERRPTVTLLDATDQDFVRLGDLRGETVQAADLPPQLIQALIATEDRRFWGHFGLDPIGIARAFYTNWQAGRTVQGGSTLTQQLVKNLFLTPQQTFKRKAQEALLALWMERRYSKDQILTAYLNRVYLGSGTFGVDAAARTYFDKPATELTLRESAIVIGLLKAPSRYSPSANPDRALQRAAVVLAAMVDAGYIDEPTARAALATPSAPQRKPGVSGDGRYFANWVADQVAAFVGPDHGDLIVHTTFQPGLQRLADGHVSSLLKASGAASRVGQAAAVLMQPDGAVLALVGGADYDSSQFNRATQALRQPGSAFKPVVFLAALEAGFQEDSLVLDAPYRRKKWAPGNYDGKFRGEITLREALAHSVNTATIRLLEQAGVDQGIRMARRLGLTSPMRRDLSLALGTSEVTPVELTGLYATLANGGRAVIPYAIRSIQDSTGRMLYQRRSSGTNPVIPGHEVQAITRLLLGPVTFGTGTAARLDGRMVAGKTGTTQDYKDAWFVGFTADLVAGVWMGNDDGTPMKRVTGGGLPAKLWHDIMLDAHAGLPARDLPGLSGGDSDPSDTVFQDLPVSEPEDQTGSPEALDRTAPSVGQASSISDLIDRLTAGQ
jgi:penicillin-binding protein 1A